MSSQMFRSTDKLMRDPSAADPLHGPSTPASPHSSFPLRHPEPSDQQYAWPPCARNRGVAARNMTTTLDSTESRSAPAHSAARLELPSHDDPATEPPIPSYEDATSPTVATAPVPFIPPALTGPHDAAADELPDYTVVDSNQTTFMIYGTFIHTPNGPAYHLSSLLDAQISKLRLRRLRAEDISLLEAGRIRNVAFDNSTTLYEAHDPPFIENAYYITSRTNSGWPGTLQLRFGVRRWHVSLVMLQGVAPKAMLTCGKTGGLRRRWTQRHNEMEPSEWKDEEGHVLATEVLKLEEGKMLPTIELSPDLNAVWRELMLALWVSRLWAGFGAGS